MVVKDSQVGMMQQSVGDVNNHITIFQGKHLDGRPQIDTEQWGGSGGPEGVSLDFYLRNIGNETAMDVEIELVADDLQNSIKLPDTIQRIDAGHLSRDIHCKYGDTDFFTRSLKNPRIVFRYNSFDGYKQESGRHIIQERRADGRFNIHTKPPVTYFNKGQFQEGNQNKMEQVNLKSEYIKKAPD